MAKAREDLPGKTEGALHYGPASVERFFHLSLDLLCIAGLDGFFKRVNPSFVRVLGWAESDLLGRPFLEFVHPEDQPATHSELNRLKAGIPTISFENRYLCADGGFRNLRWTAFPEADDGLVYAVAHDVTELKIAEKRILQQARELERLASTDPLTGLYNRRVLEEFLIKQLAIARRAGRALSLVILDIDYFKDYNDSYGHAAGDDVLRNLGVVLPAALREGDLVARYGGEEFCLVLPDASESAASGIAERIRSTLERTLSKGRVVTASLGVAEVDFSRDTSREDESDAKLSFIADELFRRSDQAMYAAKQAGRNRVIRFQDLPAHQTIFVPRGSSITADHS